MQGISRKLLVIFPLAVLVSWLLSITNGRADVRVEGPYPGLYGGSGIDHLFTNLPHVISPVLVEIKCEADLGCDGWDFTDCNTTTDACETDPESKWATVRIAGTWITSGTSGIGQASGEPPVPSDGRFFEEWAYNSQDPADDHYGISDCSGQVAPNIHRFMVSEAQWNAWLGDGDSVTIRVQSTNPMNRLPDYCCQDASGQYCCQCPDACSSRPNSTATVTITFTAAPPTGACCDASDGSCQNELTEAECTGEDLTWTEGVLCANLDPACAAAEGSCCYEDNGTYTCSDGAITKADCLAYDGSWTPDGTCALNPCGRCCAPGEDCMYTTQAHCDADDALWDSQLDCNTACPAFGSCCESPGVCSMTIEADCTEPGAVWTQGGDCIDDCAIRIYVDADVSGGNGTSWATAYDDLQDALSDASGTAGTVLICVAQGTYKPGATRESTFQLLDDVVVRGGYAGYGEVDPDERHIASYPCILSGEIGNLGSVDDNCYHVVTGDGTDGSAVIDGFTISGGYAHTNSENKNIGAGLLNYVGSPAVLNCTFHDNSAIGGGAICNYSLEVELSEPTIVNCLLFDNYAHNCGGGIYNEGTNTTLTNCIISSNTSAGNDGCGAGGMYNYTNGNVVATNCVFWWNSDPSGQSEAAQITTGVGSGVTVNVDYSCIQGLSTIEGVGNTDEDPLLVDADNDDYRLGTCSPCIDSADNGAVPQYAAIDIGNELRFMDDPATGDMGVGSSPIVDMGAYEFVPSCVSVRGDMNTDSAVDGDDILGFVNCLLLGDIEVGTCHCADMNLDDSLALNDIDCFVDILLGSTSCGMCETSGFSGRGGDCNDNGIPDANDIAYGTSEDCNRNFVPDECDIDPTDPDGDELVSNDLNTNGVPDECEPDCNKNGVPDDKDIADETSADVNANGIPDECEPDCNDNDVPDAWDISRGTSDDCNENGWPDECEPDCNENGVPDDCDIDPTDPDGDEYVSEDCNENNYPDECDLALPPPFGSLDCNDNDIPDECDLADCEGEAWCDDCNENGFLDVCDIAAEISEDENENGIPDECEGEGLLGGGGGGGNSPTGSPEGSAAPVPLGQVDPEAAWLAFIEWSWEQDWGPDSSVSGAAQFQMMVDKLQELGLPVERPW